MAATAAGAQATAEGAQPTAAGAAQVAATAAGPQPLPAPTLLAITAGAQPIPAGAAQLASTAAGAQLAIAAGAAQVAAGAQVDPQPRWHPPSPRRPLSRPQPELQPVLHFGRWHFCLQHFVRAGRHFALWQQLGAEAAYEGAGAQQLGAGAAHPWLAETSATPAHTNRTAAEKVVHFMSGTTPGKANLERRLWRTRETQVNQTVTNRLQGGGVVAVLAT